MRFSQTKVGYHWVKHTLEVGVSCWFAWGIRMSSIPISHRLSIPIWVPKASHGGRRNQQWVLIGDSYKSIACFFLFCDCSIAQPRCVWWRCSIKGPQKCFIQYKHKQWSKDGLLGFSFRNVFPSSSQVANVFLNMFPIAPHFYPICFTQSCPLFTYICRPKGRHSIFE